MVVTFGPSLLTGVAGEASYLHGTGGYWLAVVGVLRALPSRRGVHERMV